MRFGVVALFLSAGTTALSQLAAPAAVGAQKPGPTPPGILLLQKEFTRAPDLQITFGGPMKLVVPANPVPPSSAGLRRENSEMDPKMIAHPPSSSIGDQPPGTAMAQNLYPGLQLLPIEQAKAKGEPIPTTWPNLKVKQIPIVWPKFEVKPAENGAAAKSQAPAK
jgi:hypothetical protein